MVYSQPITRGKQCQSPPSPTSVAGFSVKEKYRCYPCQNFIISGGCPYHERCTYVHDSKLSSNRLVFRISNSSTQRRLHITDQKDTFYWPDVANKENQYTIPFQYASSPENFHNAGIFSIWSHFVDYILKSKLSNISKVYHTELKGPANSFVKSNRLSIFVRLGNEADLQPLMHQDQGNDVIQREKDIEKLIRDMFE